MRVHEVLRNIDDAPFSAKNGTYGGTGRKEGLIIDGHEYIVKYPRSTNGLKRTEEMKYTNDPTSEYIGSHIYSILGYPVHNTMLAKRHDKVVVACQDLTEGISDCRLLEIRTIKNSANEELSERLDRDFSATGDRHVVDFEEINLHLQYNNILCNIPGIIDFFYDMIVIDAFINNSDRNSGNWGIIREPGKEDRLSPVFDNGGAFNGKTPDSRLEKMLGSESKIKDNVLNGISAFGKDNVNFMIKDLLFFDIPELKKALIKNIPKLKENFPKIEKMIDEIPNEACSEIRKSFYKETLKARIEYLLEPAYKKALDGQKTSQTDKIDNYDPRTDD